MIYSLLVLLGKRYQLLQLLLCLLQLLIVLHQMILRLQQLMQLVQQTSAGTTAPTCRTAANSRCLQLNSLPGCQCVPATLQPVAEVTGIHADLATLRLPCAVFRKERRCVSVSCPPVSRPFGLKSSPSRVMHLVLTSLEKASFLAVPESCLATMRHQVANEQHRRHVSHAEMISRSFRKTSVESVMYVHNSWVT